MVGHTIPADTIIYGDQSTSFSQVLSDIGEIDDIQLRLSSVDDFADLSAAPVDDVEFEWSAATMISVELLMIQKCASTPSLMKV